MVVGDHHLFRCAPEETPPERWSREGEWQFVVDDPEMLALAPWKWQWDDIEGIRRRGRLVKQGPPRTVLRVPVAGREVYVKHHVVTPLRDKIRHAFVTCPPLEEFRLGRKLLRRGIATARPLLAAVRKGAWLDSEGIIVTEALPGASFPLFFSRLGSAQERASLLAHLARGVAELHDLRFWHGSLGGHHVLVEEGPRFALIDLHNSSFGLSWRVAPRSLNLWSLLKALWREATMQEWEGFLRTYTSASRRAPSPAALEFALFVRYRIHVWRDERKRRRKKRQVRDHEC